MPTSYFTLLLDYSTLTLFVDNSHVLLSLRRRYISSPTNSFQNRTLNFSLMVVIPNIRPRGPETRNLNLARCRKDSPKRRHRSEVSCEDNRDDDDDPADSDYMHDSADDLGEISVIPHRTKRVRRTAAPRAAKSFRYNSIRNVGIRQNYSIYL
jgi:hypothetical protein